jgi:hypothetical protein
MVPSEKDKQLTEKFRSALVMAALFHGNQIRKGSDERPIPYLTHLLEVTAIVLAESVPEEVAIAALLHDGPEDAGGLPTLNLIRLAFGDRVKDIVAACTDTFEAKKPDWPVRKQQYLDHLGQTNDFDVLLVKCADCLSNARATLADYRVIGERVWERFRNMPCASNQRWWYASVRDAVRPIGAHTRAFSELDEVVNALVLEISPCPGCGQKHVTMPPVPAARGEADLEDLFDGGFDPAHRCPACGRVPWAPADGSGRACPNCGNRWMTSKRTATHSAEGE